MLQTPPNKWGLGGIFIQLINVGSFAVCIYYLLSIKYK